MFKWITRAVGRIFNTGLANPARWLADAFTSKADTGISVNSDNVIGYAPVWYAVNKIAGHVGQLPCSLHRKRGDTVSTQDSHPAHSILKSKPNSYQTPILFKETMIAHALLWGNARAAIVRDGNRIVELLPLPPDKTDTVMVEGQKWHVLDLDLESRLTALGGTTRGREVSGKYAIPDDEVFHVPGLSFNGIKGISLIQAAKNVFGIGLGAEKATSKDFANGSKPSVVLEAPAGQLRDDKDAKEFIDNFNKYHQGLDNHGKAALLREGVTANTLSMSADDARWVEQRLFQRQETALLFLLESILGDDSSVSYNSLEQKNLAYLSNCLMRWLKKWEEEADLKLLTKGERTGGYYFKFNFAAILRADHKTTVESLSLAIASRIMNPNEARKKLDLNPYEGGDEYENPAITPGSPGGTSVEDANRQAVLAHLTHMIKTESHKVLFAAGKGNYLNWLDKFYSGWESKLGESIESLGGSRDVAKEHCEESKNQLIELAGTVTQDGIAEAVSELVDTWPSRADELADKVLGVLANV